MTNEKKSRDTIKKRHSKRQRKRILMMKIRRIIFFATLITIFLVVILFYTPIFKIRGVDILGNDKVELSEVTSIIGDIEGNNLFRTNTSAIKKKLLKLPYIEEVKTDRIVFKSRLKIDIKEAKEAASISSGSGYIIINTEAKVLSETQEKPEGIPEITGLTLNRVSLGDKLEIDDKEKYNIVLTCLEEMEKNGFLSGVRNISVVDLGNITFNYEDRLDAICGSMVDLSKKLTFFKSAISSSRLTENSRGTIDLTTVGKAIYTP